MRVNHRDDDQWDLGDWSVVAAGAAIVVSSNG
jgi:hypothetical protein